MALGWSAISGLESIKENMRSADAMACCISAEYPGQVLDRPHHEGDVGDKSLNPADGHSTRFSLVSAVPDDRTEGKSRRQLDGGQKQSAQPGGAITMVVHFAGQYFEFFQVLVFPPKAFTTRTPLMFSLKAPTIFEFILRVLRYS